MGDVLEVELEAWDPDDDPLVFAVHRAPEGATLESLGPTRALLRWAPLASQTAPGGKQWTFKVSVSDPQGAEDGQQVVVEVVPAYGQPQVTSGTVCAPRLLAGGAVVCPVVVKDDDNEQVGIELLEGPPGARFEQTGRKRGVVVWEPPAGLLSVGSRWPVRLRVDDGQWPPVEHEVEIDVLPGGGAECLGTPPTLDAAPLGDLVPGEPLAWTVRATDLESYVARVEMVVDTGSGAWLTLPLAPDAGGSWTLSFAPGETLPAGSLVRYALVAVDDDDLYGARCDHAARWPAVGWQAFAVWDGAGCGPDDEYEPNNTPDQARRLEGGSAGPLRLCADDWFEVAAAPGEPLAVVARSAVPDASVRLEVTDLAGTPYAADEAEGSVRVEATVASGMNRVLVHVAPAAGSPPLSYELAWGPAACGSDAGEPDVPSAPAEFDGTAMRRTCVVDADWLSVALGGDSLVDVSVTSGSPLVDAVVSLVDPATGAVEATAGPGLAPLRLRAFASGDDGVWLRAQGVGPAATNLEFSANVAALAESCPPDALGSRGTADSPAPLLAGAAGGLWVCASQSDWFAYPAQPGDHLVLEAVAPDGARLDLDAYEGSPEAVAARAEGPWEHPVTTVDWSSDAPLLVRVGDAQTGWPVPYALDVTVVPTSPPTCDGSAQPVALEGRRGAWQRRGACPDEPFAVRASAVPGDLLVALVAALDGPAVARWVDPTGHVEASVDVPGGERRELRSPVVRGGDWQLEVRPAETAATGVWVDVSVARD